MKGMITTKLKSLFGAQDMTVGSPFKAMMKFAVPLLIGNVAQLMYNTADSIIVGKMLVQKPWPPWVPVRRFKTCFLFSL